MEPTQRSNADAGWRWFVAAYCYLVLFHLVPLLLLPGLNGRIAFGPYLGFGRGFFQGGFATVWYLAGWTSIGAGVAAFVIAWLSRRLLLLESLCTGILYLVTLTIVFQKFLHSHSYGFGSRVLLFWLAVVSLLTVVGAWSGAEARRRYPGRLHPGKIPGEEGTTKD